MAVLVQVNAQEYIGVSTEPKPSGLRAGALWTNKDTGTIERFDGTNWFTLSAVGTQVLIYGLLKEKLELFDKMFTELIAIRMGMQISIAQPDASEPDLIDQATETARLISVEE